MKQILLIRHAKSSWADESLEDLDRPLNNRGKKEATLLGKIFKKKGLLPQLIISSPAKRARKTTKKIAKALLYPKGNVEINNQIFSGNLPSLIELIHSIDKKRELVFIVGHNPSLLELGNYLTGANIEKLLTSGFILIEFKFKLWRDITEGSGVIALIDRAPGNNNEL